MSPASKPVTTARKRRALGWALIAAGLLITGAWAGSQWRWYGYVSSSWSSWCSSGALTIATPAWNMFDTATGWKAKPPATGSRWQWTSSGPAPNALIPTPTRDINFHIARFRQIRGTVFLDILLWPPALAALFAGGALLWSARRAQRRAALGLCPNCRYNLTGLDSGTPCPECGRPNSAAIQLASPVPLRPTPVRSPTATPP